MTKFDPWADRHPSVAHFERLFVVNSKLPRGLRVVSLQFTELAEAMVTDLGDGPELSAGLRKLLEAKDCFVRQALLDGQAEERVAPTTDS